MKKSICEVCCEREAEGKFRSIRVCPECEEICERLEKEDRGTNLEEYEEYDEEDSIVPKKDNPIPSEYSFSSYRRVVPRDLFNESKLLKCLGKIAIGILDGKLGEFQLEEKFTNPKNGFKIVQNDDGDIMCENYRVFKGDHELYLFTRLNSKANWPLMTIDHNSEYIDVMDDNGKFTGEFLEYLSSI